MSTPYENFGKYILLEKLATGGMAEVFLARGTGAGGIGKFFAIKRILPQYADSPEFIDMFKDEAKIAINLNHSNIVSIHEFGIERGQFFLVMDYVEGRNLRQILNKMKKTSQHFTSDQVVYLIKEVAAGLDHAHRTIDGSTGKPLNITHRDISPQNIMCTFEGEAKIVDFGIAKAESQIENTRAGTLKGKFGYMSPEQAEGLPVDMRTDIFSLGIVLWELLASDRLFVANNEINTLRKIRDCQIPSLRKIDPNIPVELERIVQKALARDRNLRYQTGAALHRDLSRFLNRQFPDFSVQDFAVFIKGVFADEILSLRKRLVEYLRINPQELAAEAPRDLSNDTALMSSETGSIVMTGSGAETGSYDHSRPNNRQTEETAENTGHSAVEVSIVPRRDRVPLLDEAALAESAKTTPQPPKPPDDGEDMYSLKVRRPSVTNSGTPATRTRPVETRRPPAVAAKSRGPKSATLVVFLGVCAGTYLYLAKYQTESMTPLIAAVDPLLHPIHKALGVDPAQRAVANAPRIATAPAVAAPAKPAGSNGNEDHGLIVTSNPSGAEIFLNEQPTGLSTPNRIEISTTGAFAITVRKRGYSDLRRSDLTLQSTSHRLDLNLEKSNIGYLDVEIFPPQDAELFINNHAIPVSRSIARDIAIPAGVPVRVRAQSPNGNTFDELTVTVAVDHRKTVQINPRKLQRPTQPK